MKNAMMSLGAVCLMVAGSTSLNAQSCKGNAKIDTIYQQKNEAETKGSVVVFDYYIKLRNEHREKPVTVTVTFKNMISGVSLFSPSLPGITLGLYETKTIKVGKGTANVNSNLVRILGDVPSPAPAYAYVAPTACRVG